MLYLSLGHNSFEAIETKNILLKGEKIKSVSHGIVNNDFLTAGTEGSIGNLENNLQELFKSAYPSPIEEREIALLLPDDNLVSHRFTLTIDKSADPTAAIINQAQKILPGPITNYENFYQDLAMNDTKKILFSAFPTKDISLYYHFFQRRNYKLSFLTTQSFAIFTLLKGYIKHDETVLFFESGRHHSEQMIFDELGLIEYQSNKITKKLASDIKTTLPKILEKDHSKVKRVFLFGEKSLEFKTDDLSLTDIPVVRIGDIIDEILSQNKITIDTGGIPKMYFAKLLGLMLLSKGNNLPNFARDAKVLISKKQAEEISFTQESPKDSQSFKVEEEDQVKSTEEVKEAEEKEEMGIEENSIKEDEEKETISKEAIMPPEGISGQIAEYKKSTFPGILLNKIAVMVILSVIFIIIGIGIILRSQTQIGLPFVVKPSLTPTPTVQPTLTPTPTVDPNLKRGDVIVSVQNGTETAGLAKSTADSLEKLGYKNIAVGNADSDTYELTIIKIKDNQKKYLPLIINDLMDKFDTQTIQTLGDDSKFDVVVILGKK